MPPWLDYETGLTPFLFYNVFVLLGQEIEPTFFQGALK